VHGWIAVRLAMEQALLGDTRRARPLLGERRRRCRARRRMTQPACLSSGMRAASQDGLARRSCSCGIRPQRACSNRRCP
jgi:hypothetical protein